jgi:hypothetical protein
MGKLCPTSFSLQHIVLWLGQRRVGIGTFLGNRAVPAATLHEICGKQCCDVSCSSRLGSRRVLAHGFVIAHDIRRSLDLEFRTCAACTVALRSTLFRSSEVLSGTKSRRFHRILPFAVPNNRALFQNNGVPDWDRRVFN